LVQLFKLFDGTVLLLVGGNGLFIAGIVVWAADARRETDWRRGKQFPAVPPGF
jgi:hypothetical protein